VFNNLDNIYNGITSESLKFHLIYLLLILNSLKFIGLDYTPPGFYIDEVAGAVQAICLQESGRDFYGDFLPLFAPGVNDAFYTPTYLYGQAGSVFLAIPLLPLGRLLPLSLLSVLAFSISGSSRSPQKISHS